MFAVLDSLNLFKSGRAEVLPILSSLAYAPEILIGCIIYVKYFNFDLIIDIWKRKKEMEGENKNT